jgi:hypothetical protein
MTGRLRRASIRLFENMTAGKNSGTLSVESAFLFLIVILLGDLVYIVLHIITVFTPLLSNRMLRIDTDKGYAEMYQYLKFFWIVLLLIYLSLKNRTFCYAAWALVFTYFLFDDALCIHEKGGRLIASRLDIVPLFGLGLKDYGELSVSVMASVLLAVP